MRGSGEWAGAFLEVCELSQARAGDRSQGAWARTMGQGAGAGTGVRVLDKGSGCRTRGQGAGAAPGVKVLGLGQGSGCCGWDRSRRTLRWDAAPPLWPRPPGWSP